MRRPFSTVVASTRVGVITACWLILACRPVPAAAPPAKWTVEDVIHAEIASDFQFSPDGKAVVWVKLTPDKTRGEMVPQLIRTDLATRRETVLTRGPEGSPPRAGPLTASASPFSAPARCPAVRRSAARTAATRTRRRLWLIDPFGGEPWPLTELARGVNTYDWAGADHLVFAAQEEPTLRESRCKDEKTTRASSSRTSATSRRFACSRSPSTSKKVTRLTDNRDRIESLAVSPDGRYAVTIHGRSLRYTYDNKVKPVVFLYDLEAGTRRRIFDDPSLNVREVAWSPDGKGFYATNEHSTAGRSWRRPA